MPLRQKEEVRRCAGDRHMEKDAASTGAYDAGYQLGIFLSLH